MSLRDTLNNNPAAVTGGAVVLLLLCLFLVYCQLSGGGGSGSFSIVYYDVSAKQIRVVQAKSGADRPPNPLEEGSEIFEARVYSCGECGELKDGMTEEDLKANGMFVGYMIRWNEGSEFGEEYYVRATSSDKWFQGFSPTGIKIEESVNSKCGAGQYAQECSPLQD